MPTRRMTNYFMEENLVTTEIIIDSNVYIAAFLTNDSRHEHAFSLLKTIKSYKHVINMFIAAEIYTIVLLKTKDAQYTTQIFRAFNLDSAGLFHREIFPITKKFFMETMSVFRELKSPNISFQDCSLIALARLKKLKTIASFDKDLRKEFAHEFEFLPKQL